VARQERWRARYAAIRPGWVPSTDIYATLIRQRVTPGSRVLDIGCGHSELVKEELGQAASVVGIDLDHDALLRNATIERSVVATAERLPFRAGSFDLVLLAWVLEHLVHPVHVFREIHRVLDRSGQVVFVTPNAWNYNAWLIRAIPNSLHPFFTRRLYGRAAVDTFPTAYRCNSPRRIEQLLGGLGFARERLIGNGDPTYVGLNAPLFRLAVWIERIYDLRVLRRARVHLVGAYRKTGSRS